MIGPQPRRTILFDLYGTLVPGGSRLQRDTLAFQMADVLEVDRTKFVDIVRDTFDARVRGTMGGLSETISELARLVGGTPNSRQIALAAEQRLSFSRGLLSDTYSVSHLSQLKSRGYHFGIVTDCSAETPLSWTSSWLSDVIDVVAFSCELGVRKPDPEIYLTATRCLNVQPEECVFIGDGGSNELFGAHELGMATTMLVDPNLLNTDRFDEVGAWDGAIITSLAELVHDSRE
ncbi:MAG: HAD-IA family hydrolase [Acidobacteria bacterium]|nr:HAD-IA family hydrolase [Acidobacteriota bacterium]